MKSFFQGKNITKTLLLSSSFSIILLPLLLLFSFYPSYFANAQEEIITIVPGSSDSSRYRFFDITEYPISTGEEIKWFNADNIIHNIVVTSNSSISNGKDNTIVQSNNIQPNGFFNYKFDKEGEYIFQSSKYDWMKGKIIVTDDIKTVKKSMEENDIDVYISWTPSSFKVGEKSLFKIIFVDKNSEKNQEHIDYSLTIQNPSSSSSSSNKVLYKNAITHSAWGVEPASHIFDSEGSFIGKLGIEGILFQPIEPEYTEFETEVIK